MADVTLVASQSNNGTTSPATPGSITPTAHDLMIAVVAVLGTNPTITTPASWTQLQKTSGATLSVGMYAFANVTSGAKNPSFTLGGTVTGWLCMQAEFSQCGANGIVQNSVQQTSAVAQLTDIFQAADNSALMPQLLYFYAVASSGATLTANNTGVNPPGGATSWSTSVQSQTGVQGLSMDFFWASGLCCGSGCVPIASGKLSSAVASVAIAAWANTTASNPQSGSDARGIFVGGQYAGMTGG